MKPMIQELSIERYRTLRSLHVNGFGCVNLITGRNNSGKSSVLEALRILASGASPEILYEIVGLGEEEPSDSQSTKRSPVPDASFDLAGLFYGFPPFSPNSEPISIVAMGESTRMSLTLAMSLAVEGREQDSSAAYVRETAEPYAADGAVPSLAIENDGMRRVRSLDWIQRTAQNRSASQYYAGESLRVPCQYLGAYGGAQTAMLGDQWDEIALAGREQYVVDALRILDPGITSVAMIGGGRLLRGRRAIVKSSTFARPVPLRTFGDGMNRLFGIILALVNAKDGLLLIDEFENGLHYAVQHEIWRLVFELAGKLNVQVLATSHSWDTVEAFQRAASESPADGVLVRLLRKRDDIIATVFGEEDLRIVTRDKIEVR